MNINVIITLSFEAIHCWKNCFIDEVSFLKNPHRHIFHIQIKFPVNHTDRDIEFIQMKRKIQNFLKIKYDGKDIGTLSCEDICLEIMNEYPNINYIKVMEDNENGAEINLR